LAAAFLLSLLSVITIIQVSHSHAAVSPDHWQQKSFVQKTGLPGFTAATVESKCFICEYQLAKDIDAVFSIFAIVSPACCTEITAAHYSFTFQRISSQVETRGPPAIA
jgi:hypothetical protein